MKSSPRFLLLAALLGLSAAPSVGFADYMPAATAVDRLESIVKLTPDQEKKAYQIFQNLKDVMDSMSPEERPSKGAEVRRLAIRAIRSVLTPEQQAIYDRTPQRFGGAGAAGDSKIQALNLKIRRFVGKYVRNSPEVGAQVGTVQKVVVEGLSTTTSDGQSILHPDGGGNLVRVTGSSGTKTFKIAWAMDASGAMTVTQLVLQAN